MQDRTLIVNISEIVYTNFAYLVQKLVDEEGSVDFSESGLLRNNYRFLSAELKGFVDEMTVDLVSALEQYLGSAHANASRYSMLPKSIREFVEASPSDVFILGNRLTEAVKSREALIRIMKLMAERCSGCISECVNCFLSDANRILEESGLTPVGG